jgi:hypothetical protein
MPGADPMVMTQMQTCIVPSHVCQHELVPADACQHEARPQGLQHISEVCSQRASRLQIQPWSLSCDVYGTINAAQPATHSIRPLGCWFVSLVCMFNQSVKECNHTQHLGWRC